MNPIQRALDGLSRRLGFGQRRPESSRGLHEQNATIYVCPTCRLYFSTVANLRGHVCPRPSAQ